MAARDTINMCEKHEVRFYKGVCDICLMMETISMSRRMFELTLDALQNGKQSDAVTYIQAALNGLPNALTLGI